MTGLIWLDDATPFPDPGTALPEGLLAVGANLSLERLQEAYRKGIFPWFNPGDPILWWSPNPRMVLACADFKVSHSLRKKLRQIARREAAADAPPGDADAETRFGGGRAEPGTRWRCLGVGSDLAWNIQGFVGYRTSLFGVPTTLAAGYRALHQDYDHDDFEWDVTMHGPVLGAVLRF